MEITGDVRIDGNLTLTGNVSNTSISNINVTTTYYQLVVTSDVSVNGHLYVLNDTSLNGQLFVSNDTSMNGNIVIGGNVTMNSNSHLYTGAVFQF